MIFTPLPLKGAYIINLEKNKDHRGFFARLYCNEEFKKNGLNYNFVQMNNSFSRKKGTVRGLHFQRPPKAETKIMRCFRGAAWDVIVDIRSDSPTYGKWHGVELNEENRTMIYVPIGFAHGFQTLTDDVEQLYVHSEFYNQEHQGGLRYNDQAVAIEWPLPVTEISFRDKSYPFLEKLTPISL